MPRCDRGDEGTALNCLALIFKAVVVVECKSHDKMETGSSTRHLCNFWQEELMGRPSLHYCAPLKLPGGLEDGRVFLQLGLYTHRADVIST